MNQAARSALVRGLVWIVSAALVAALVLHLTIRDRSVRFSALFYAMPWPVMGLLATGVAVYWLRRDRRLAAAHAVLALGCATGWLSEEWFWRPASTARGELRVVLWNVARPNGRFAGIAQWLRAQDADIIAIAERQPRRRDLTHRWRDAFPDYRMVTSDGEMLCLIRGELLGEEQGLLREGNYGTLIRARVKGREVTVLQADLQGYATSYRGAALDFLRGLMAQNHANYFVMLGDFNTPHTSIFFRSWRRVGRDAFETAGSGCAATWPALFPVLSLDHVWSSPRLKPVHCELHSLWRSDHRAVVADYDFLP